MHDRGSMWIAPAAWIVGVASLLCDHFQGSVALVIAMRTLFGLATCAAICLVLIPKARATAGTSQLELYLFTRLVSRWVYILMYLLAAARVSLYVYDVSQHCTRSGPDCVGSIRPLDDFQFYVAFSVVPLWIIRAMVLTLPFRNSGEPRVLL
jgi:hypothetical protein